MRYIALSKRRASESRFSCSLLGRTPVRGEQGCRTLASVLWEGTVLGGCRRFLGFRLELLPRLRRLEIADVVQKPVATGVAEVRYMTSSQEDLGVKLSSANSSII